MPEIEAWQPSQMAGWTWLSPPVSLACLDPHLGPNLPGFLMRVQGREAGFSGAEEFSVTKVTRARWVSRSAANFINSSQRISSLTENPLERASARLLMIFGLPPNIKTGRKRGRFFTRLVICSFEFKQDSAMPKCCVKI